MKPSPDPQECPGHRAYLLTHTGISPSTSAGQVKTHRHRHTPQCLQCSSVHSPSFCPPSCGLCVDTSPLPPMTQETERQDLELGDWGRKGSGSWGEGRAGHGCVSHLRSEPLGPRRGSSWVAALCLCKPWSQSPESEEIKPHVTAGLSQPSEHGDRAGL